MSLEQLSSAEVVRRGIRGAAALAGRQAIAQGLNVAGAIALANILDRAEFGIFGITVFVLQFLVTFGDAGLAASLIREQEQPTELDYRAVFTAQQFLVVAVVVVGFIFRPWAAGHFAHAGDIGFLFGAALVALLVTSFQVIPSVRLERELRFDRLAIVEVGQAVAFNVIAVGTALSGAGAGAMAYALVARAVTGAVLVQFVEPWAPRWGWAWERIQARLRFGLPFQGTLIVNLLRDSLAPIFIGTLLGEEVVGQVFWATMLATYPLLVLHMFGRLFLPAFARLGDRPSEQRRIIERALFAISCLAVPASVLICALGVPVSDLVFGGKWGDALPIYYLIWVGTWLEGSVIVALSVLNAAGRSNVVFRFVVVMTVLTWILGVVFIPTLGPIGYGVMSLCTQPVKLLFIKEAAEISLGGRAWLRVLLPLWGAGLALGILVGGGAYIWKPQSLLSLTAWFLSGGALYASFVVLIDLDRARRTWTWVRLELGGT